MVKNSRMNNAKGKGQKVEGIAFIIPSAMRYALCALLFMPVVTCYAASPRQNLEEGNRLYKKGKIDEALGKYNEAGTSMPDSDIINFNTGAALYKKEDYQKAADAFSRALTSDNRKIEADALYNLGNTKYKLGKLEENTDPESTVGLLKEALDYYKRAVEIDQENTDARFNHEFVEKELKILMDKLKQQQSEEKKQQNKQGRKEREQKSSSGEKGKDEQKQQEKQAGQQGEKQQNRQEQGEQKKQNSGNEQEQQKEQAEQEQEQPAEAKEEKGQQQQEEAQAAAAGEKSKQEEEKENLTKEEAATLLERYGREARPDYMNRRVKSYDNEVLKDW